MLVGPLLAGAGGVWAAAGMTPANAIAAMNDAPATAVEALTAWLFAMMISLGCEPLLAAFSQVGALTRTDPNTFFQEVCWIYSGRFCAHIP
jgi:hypothetical protein